MQTIGYYYGQFIDNMKAEKNCSELTAKSYWTVLYIFREFLIGKEVEELSQITTSLLR